MTTDLTTEYSLTALTQILSALDGQKRNPCTKKAAIKAINKKAEALGLAPDDVFDGAAALLGGKDPEDWRDELLLIERFDAEAEVQAEAEAQIETEDEPAEPAEPEAEEPVAPAQEDEPIDLHSQEFATTEVAQANEASWPSGRKTRENSKQARMIAMLKRPEGATVNQIAAEMGWQKHTVRGAISGALRKKLGLNITSGKIDGQLTYRIDD